MSLLLNSHSSRRNSRRSNRIMSYSRINQTCKRNSRNRTFSPTRYDRKASLDSNHRRNSLWDPLRICRLTFSSGLWRNRMLVICNNYSWLLSNNSSSNNSNNNKLSNSRPVNNRDQILINSLHPIRSNLPQIDLHSLDRWVNKHNSDNS